MDSAPPPIPLLNPLNGRSYHLIPARELSPNQENLNRLVAVCNEPEIYAWLFHGPLEGRPYELSHAQGWLNSAREGWESGSHSIFAVRDDQHGIAAACDIKSTAAVAELGYWASRHHRGIMTNTVHAVCAWARAAGYQGLFARTKPANHPSQAVLARTGFRPVPSAEPDYLRFERRFSSA